MMRGILGFVACVGALVVLTGGAALARGPIVILGDADFTADNGVVGGAGTADSPYLIAGAEITAGAGDLYAVRIENTRAWFVLRGLIIQGAIDTGGAAVRIAFATNGRIEGCTISGSVNGIELASSSGIAMRNCVLYTTGSGLRVAGDSAEQHNHDIDASNQLNGKEIRYFYGLDGATVSGYTTSHLTVAGSRNVTIADNAAINGDGIRLAFVTGSTVTRNAAYRTTPAYTEHGMFLLSSSDNVIEQNSLRNNRLAGMQLTLSSRNAIRNNQFLANDSGIRLVASDENQISGNVLYANVSGILLSGGSSGNTVAENVLYHENTMQGITLELADGNRIERNGLSDCEVGVTLGEQATGNVVTANTILAGAYGISVYGSYNWIERNLVAQEQRGVLFPETFGRSTARGNQIRGNVFADNNQHLYLNLDSAANQVGDNALLGNAAALVADYGVGNAWTIDGAGNFWGETAILDANGDGVSDAPITVYPSTAQDTAPRAAWTPVGSGLGILGTLQTGTASVVTSGGGTIQVSVLLAKAGIERWAGFRGFPGAYSERFPGILFSFDSEAQVKFTMQTVLFDLDIAFFKADGSYAGGTTMKANSDDVYTASSAFLYAIELPAGSLERLGIGDGARLVLP